MTSPATDPDQPAADQPAAELTAGPDAVLAALAEFRRWAEARFDRVEERLRRIEGDLAELRGRWAD